MYATVNGFRVEMVANGTRDSLVVKVDGIETEEQAINIASLAARNGYPIGSIDIVSVQAGRWCPIGLPANECGTAVWCSE